MHKISLSSWSNLELLQPTYALAAGVDLVVIRWPDERWAFTGLRLAEDT